MKDDDSNQRQVDATGLVQSACAANGERPYLGDIATLDKLLREMAAGVLERYSEVATGRLAPDEAVSADQEACRQLARTMIGQNPDYAPVLGWSDHGLADSIRLHLDEAIRNEDDVSVVAQAVAMFVHALYKEIHALPEEPDQKSIEAGIGEVVRSFVWMLIGLHSNE